MYFFSQVLFTWKFVYNLHFLKQAEQTAQKCQKGYILRKHSPEVRTIVYYLCLRNWIHAFEFDLERLILLDIRSIGLLIVSSCV